MHDDGDFIASLGIPFLSHRLRRISAMINEGTTQLLRAGGCVAPATSVSTLLLLDRHGPLGIMEIAARLKLDHALIVRLTNALARSHYVDLGTDPQDKRRKIVTLTPQGTVQARKIEQINTVIAAAFGELSDEIGTDLLAVIERFEGSLNKKSMAERLADKSLLELSA
jgi:DNA-binding MarR family transcriptional regulator